MCSSTPLMNLRLSVTVVHWFSSDYDNINTIGQKGEIPEAN